MQHANPPDWDARFPAGVEAPLGRPALANAFRRARSPLFLLFACLSGICLLSMSKNVAMMNQGDFYRVFDSLLNAQPLDVRPYDGYKMPAFVWSYTDPVKKSWRQRNLAWVYVWANVRLQRLVSTHFDLFLLALVSKLIVLACCYRLSETLRRHLALRAVWRPLVFALLAIAFFFAHNIAFLNSFYQEHVFVVFLPVFLVGLFEKRRGVRLTLCITGALFCGGAKAQYFYLPALIAAVLALIGILHKRKPDWQLMAGLLAAFGVSYFLVSGSTDPSVNYYNSTYFGSYLLLSAQERKQLGVSDRNMQCIGSDPWGHQLDANGIAHFNAGPSGCAERVSLTVNDILAPYWRHPTLMFRLWHWAAPVHFTVKSFHLFKYNGYILPSDTKSYHNGRNLVVASDLRDAVITRYYLVFLAAGLLLPFVNLRSTVSIEMRMATLLLALFIPSQIAFSLLGEGLRDLSKHLAAAQLCLDLLCVFLILQLIAWASAKTTISAQTGTGVRPSRW
jgi:hypothetical protein